MKKIEAPTINDALIKASEALGVSVVEIEYEVVQEPSKGFLGFGKKSAIIVANVKESVKESARNEDKSVKELSVPDIAPAKSEPLDVDVSSMPPKPPRLKIVAKAKDRIIEESETNEEKTIVYSKAEGEIYENFFQKETDALPNRFSNKIHIMQTSIEKVSVKETRSSHPKISSHEQDSKDKIEKEHRSFDKNKDLQHSIPLSQIALEVQKEINELFALMPFNIDPIKVSVFDEHTLFIEFHGEDAALLIGKEGYRYKALSYMLFHWINTRYNLMVRLEIAEFLHNQELMIAHYLTPLIESINETGRGQTRPLDGVLAYIALRQLRNAFPDKYVSFRKNTDGEKYVIVNEFYH